MNRTPIQRLTARITIDGGCWIFTGATRNGYGAIGVGGRVEYTHRISYEHFVGVIPDGKHIDHLCRNRRCCNPDHLEPVTQAENNLRSWAARGPKTHCKNGHEFTPDNTGTQASGHRRCLTCNRESARRSYRQKRAA